MGLRHFFQDTTVSLMTGIYHNIGNIGINLSLFWSGTCVHRRMGADKDHGVILRHCFVLLPLPVDHNQKLIVEMDTPMTHLYPHTLDSCRRWSIHVSLSVKWPNETTFFGVLIILFWWEAMNIFKNIIMFNLLKSLCASPYNWCLPKQDSYWS